MDNTERDELICQRYLSGELATDIGKDLGISRERIRQILREHGFPPMDEILPGVIPSPDLTARDQFLGVMLTEDEKRTIRAEAVRRGGSMSALAAGLIRKGMKESVA